MGFATATLGESEITDSTSCLNWFKIICSCLLEITDLLGVLGQCMKQCGSQVTAETDNIFETLVTSGSLNGSYAPVSYDKEMISVNSFITVLYNLR